MAHASDSPAPGGRKTAEPRKDRIDFSGSRRFVQGGERALRFRLTGLADRLGDQRKPEGLGPPGIRFGIREKTRSIAALHLGVDAVVERENELGPAEALDRNQLARAGHTERAGPVERSRGTTKLVQKGIVRAIPGSRLEGVPQPGPTTGFSGKKPSCLGSRAEDRW